jgi:ribosomal subunit interface protein
MLPLQITMRAITETPAIKNHILKYYEKINRMYHGLIDCHITIDCMQKRKHQQKLYSVNINAAVPEKKIVVSKKKNVDFYLAVRDGFLAFERLLARHYKSKPKRTGKFVVRSKEEKIAEADDIDDIGSVEN